MTDERAPAGRVGAGLNVFGTNKSGGFLGRRGRVWTFIAGWFVCVYHMPFAKFAFCSNTQHHGMTGVKHRHEIGRKCIRQIGRRPVGSRRQHDLELCM